MIVRVAREALSRLTGARPALLLAEDLHRPEALAAPALDLWVAAPRGPVTLLHPHGDPAPDPDLAVELPAPPVAFLAAVATDDALGPLLAWWAEESARPAPPLVTAPDGPAALGPVLRHVSDALAATADREAALGDALAALRLELEETRAAADGLSRRFARLPPCSLRLVLDGDAGEATAPAPPAGEPLRLRAELGVMLAGLAALAVHLAVLPPSGALRIRLVGARTGRVAGSWFAPHVSLAPGWLPLDLPTPLPALREAAVLEITAEGAASPALSLDPRWAGLDGAHPLALRAWSGEPGGRYVLPRFWDPSEVAITLPPPGAPHALPEGTWRTARTLEGAAPTAALGSEEPRPILRAEAGGRAILLLPHLHAPGMDRLRIALRPAGGTGGRVAAWAHPVGASLSDLSALDRLDIHSATTGWRDLAEAGTDLTLLLPGTLSGQFQLAIGLLAPDDAPAMAEPFAATFEASRPDVILPPARAMTPAPPVPEAPLEPAARSPLPQPASPVPLPPRPAPLASPRSAPPPSLPAAPPPSFPGIFPARVPSPASRAPIPSRHETVRLHQHLPGASYEHLDLTVTGLSRGPLRWPNVRVKLAMNAGKAQVEFRRAAGWPSVFQDWLGTASDRFGPFLRVTLPDLPAFLARITDEKDAALMQALLAVLPSAGEAAAREAKLPLPEVSRWVQAARALQEASRPEARRDPSSA